MLKIKKEGILIEKTNLVFEHEGVLNPAVIRDGDFIHMFYRAVSDGNYSSIGYCKFSGPSTLVQRNQEALIVPEFDYESHGVEDPRIVKIEGIYYLSYTAYDGINALGALATSTDLIHWQKIGLVVPKLTYDEFNFLANSKTVLNEKYLRYNEHDRMFQKENKEVFIWDKNLIFFPRKINGKFNFLHRIKPDVQIVCEVNSVEELTPIFWEKYFLNFNDNIVLSPKYEHEISYIGGGCPPIETPKGWLIIYHGVKDSMEGYVYSVCAALLDLEKPQKEIARLPYPLFVPEEVWELKGEVNNVCFPTGSAVFDDTLYIYYGAADERIAYASMSMSELISELLANTLSEIV